MNKIKLSPETVSILDAAAKINGSIKLSKGNIIKTVSIDDAVAMYAVVNDEIPSDAAFYDLGQFLNLFKMQALKDSEVEFQDKKVIIHGDRTTVQYWFTDPTFLKDTDKVKDIQLPSVDLEVDVTQEDLNSFIRGAATLGHKYIQFVVKSGEVKLVATTTEIDTSNNLEINIGETDSDDSTYTLSIGNLKLIPGNYTVQITNAGVTKWMHKDQKVIFYIGLEIS